MALKRNYRKTVVCSMRAETGRQSVSLLNSTGTYVSHRLDFLSFCVCSWITMSEYWCEGYKQILVSRWVCNYRIFSWGLTLIWKPVLKDHLGVMGGMQNCHKFSGIFQHIQDLSPSSFMCRSRWWRPAFVLEGKEGEERKRGPQRTKEKMTVWCQAPRIQEVGGARVGGELPGIKVIEYEDLGWRWGKGTGSMRPPWVVEPPCDLCQCSKSSGRLALRQRAAMPFLLSALWVFDFSTSCAVPPGLQERGGQQWVPVPLFWATSGVSGVEASRHGLSCRWFKEGRRTGFHLQREH